MAQGGISISIRKESRLDLIFINRVGHRHTMQKSVVKGALNNSFIVSFHNR